jgi:hypothetical protein
LDLPLSIDEQAEFEACLDWLLAQPYHIQKQRFQDNPDLADCATKWLIQRELDLQKKAFEHYREHGFPFEHEWRARKQRREWWDRCKQRHKFLHWLCEDVFSEDVRWYFQLLLSLLFWAFIIYAFIP